MSLVIRHSTERPVGEDKHTFRRMSSSGKARSCIIRSNSIVSKTGGCPKVVPAHNDASTRSRHDKKVCKSLGWYEARRLRISLTADFFFDFSNSRRESRSYCESISNIARMRAFRDGGGLASVDRFFNILYSVRELDGSNLQVNLVRYTVLPVNFDPRVSSLEFGQTT